MRAIDADALCEYANNQRDKTIDANDIMRFPAIELTNDLPPARDSHHDLGQSDGLLWYGWICGECLMLARKAVYAT